MVGFQSGDPDAGLDAVVGGAADHLVDEAVFQVADVADALEDEYGLERYEQLVNLFLM